MDFHFNRLQTQITQEILDKYPKEVQEQFIEDINNIPFVKSLISKDRPYARDIARDNDGKIIIDITKPHILEDMDYFRPSALHYEKYGCYTNLAPNSNPNSEFGKWLREEARRCYKGYVRESDGEWITGEYYFFLNYCPIQVAKVKKGSKRSDRIIQFPHVWEGHYYLFHYWEMARNNGHHACMLARRGAHPYFQKVFTPEGWKNWGDIKIGDSLYSSNNTVCKVTNIPYNKEAPYYRITLRDGREIYATDDHLWNIVNKGKEITVSTAWLLQHYKHNRKKNYRIPNGEEYNCFIRKNDGVEMPHKITNVEPYTFGLLLGDGCFRAASCYYVQISTDMETEKQYIPYNIIKWQNKYAYKIDIPNWNNIKKEYGLDFIKSEDKFIPDEYKYNSKEVRLKVLKGLLDSDGYVHGGAPVLTSTSKRLIDDVSFIAKSLGYNTNFVKKKAGYKKDGVYKQCLDSYELTIYAGPEIFNLHRKQTKVQYNSSNAKSRRDKTCIINIEYIGMAPCKCVTVDSEDNCYLIGDFVKTHNCGKSFTAASRLARNFVLGDIDDDGKPIKKVQSVVTAAERKYIQGANQLLDMFVYYIDFLANNTQFPSKRLINSLHDMQWTMGYIDAGNGTKKGTLNSVTGITSKDDESKLIGSRGQLYIIEEMGSFPRLLGLYARLRPSVEDGENVFGQIEMHGTSGDDESNFSSAQEIMYNPKGYNVQALPNIYDIDGKGRKDFTYFFPSYLNRANCYDENGNSDVIKALLEILKDRYIVKYNSTDIRMITKRIAELPITPAEAVLRASNNIFPVSELQERLMEIDNNPSFYNDTYIGELVAKPDGRIEFKPTLDNPIRDFKINDNDIVEGALEIFEMPITDMTGKIPPERYIIGHDPVDNDEDKQGSLSSTFVLDLWTDRIVAEYTGRHKYSDDNYEMLRRLCLFYNSKVLYEAHPYSQKVITPNGIKKWKDIKIGDELFSINGSITKVIDIPVEEDNMPIYNVILEDGRVVNASDNHIWSVYQLNKYVHTTHCYTTKELLEMGVFNKHGQHNFFIPNGGCVEYKKQEVPIDPYTLGLLIAEGAFTKFKKDKYERFKKRIVQFSASKEDAEFYKTVIPYDIKYIGTKGFSYHAYIDDIDLKLKGLGLLHLDSSKKFIPDLYLYNDYNTRIELLKGLMDGDGCATNSGASVYITVSERLKDTFMLLCRSLGINCKCFQKNESEMVSPTNCKTYKMKPHFRIHIYTDTTIFKLPRKIAKQHIYRPNQKGSKAVSYMNKTAIKSITFSHYERGKCVTVDREDGLYLIGDYIVTHNCNIKGCFAYFSQKNCLHLLADTPEYLVDKQLIKSVGYGNASKGVRATAPINNYANKLIQQWMLKPTIRTTINADGQEVETQVPNLFNIKNRALLKECILYTPLQGNYDRIRALGLVMLYREEKVVLYQGILDKGRSYIPDNYIGNDPFFKENYNDPYSEETESF